MSTSLHTSNEEAAGFPMPALGTPAPLEQQAPVISYEKFLPATQQVSAPVPSDGWRRWIYELTGHRYNPGLSAAEKELLDDMARARQHLTMPFYWCTFNRKGGVGKTPAALALSMTLSWLRAGATLVVEVNPDGGTFRTRIPEFLHAGVRSIIDLKDYLVGWDQSAPLDPHADPLSDYVGRDPDSGAGFLAFPKEGTVSRPLDGAGLHRIFQYMEHYKHFGYDTVGVDCGTNQSSDVMTRSVIPAVDVLVTVTTAKRDSIDLAVEGLEAFARSSEEGLELVNNSVTVVLEYPRHLMLLKRYRNKVAQAIELFEYNNADPSRPRVVVRMPFDAVLGTDDTIKGLAHLSKRTRRAYIKLAAELVDAAVRAETGAGAPPRHVAQPTHEPTVAIEAS